MEKPEVWTPDRPSITDLGATAETDRLGHVTVRVAEPDATYFVSGITDPRMVLAETYEPATDGTVKKVAAWMPATKAALDDAPARGYIETELRRLLRRFAFDIRKDPSPMPTLDTLFPITTRLEEAAVHALNRGLELKARADRARTRARDAWEVLTGKAHLDDWTR